jgi:hypothetical protein
MMSLDKTLAHGAMSGGAVFDFGAMVPLAYPMILWVFDRIMTAPLEVV